MNLVASNVVVCDIIVLLNNFVLLNSFVLFASSVGAPMPSVSGVQA